MSVLVVSSIVVKCVEVFFVNLGWRLVCVVIPCLPEGLLFLFIIL